MEDFESEAEKSVYLTQKYGFKVMNITIRMDDITPDMDWEKFLRFKSFLDEHGIKPLIGVVPDNRDKKLSLDPVRADFWSYIKELERDG